MWLYLGQTHIVKWELITCCSLQLVKASRLYLFGIFSDLFAISLCEHTFLLINSVVSRYPSINTKQLKCCALSVSINYQWTAVTHPEQSFSMSHSTIWSIWNFISPNNALKTSSEIHQPCAALERTSTCLKGAEQQIRALKHGRHMMCVSAGAINAAIKLRRCQCFQHPWRESSEPMTPGTHCGEKDFCYDL